MVPLPDWFAQLHPNFVSVHMVLSLFGVTMLCLAIFLLAVSLIFYMIPSLNREVLKWGRWLLFRSLALVLFGLYTALLAPIVLGAVCYRESRLKYSHPNRLK